MREGRCCCDSDILHVTHQATNMPSFVTLFGSGSEQALITIISFDHRTFGYLLNRFEPVLLHYTLYCADGHIDGLTETTRSSPRTLSATTCLGLILTRYRTRGSWFSLCILFGITSSVCAIFRFLRGILMCLINRDCMWRVFLPLREEVETY